MVKNLLLPVLLGLSTSAFAYAPFTPDGDPTPIRETIFYAKNGNPDWLVIKPGVQISAAELVRQHSLDLGLGEQDELRLYRTDRDALGFAHYRYQQYHRGLKVEGGEWFIHEKNDLVLSLNGKLVRGLRAFAQVEVAPEKAVELALAKQPASRYMWENATATALLRQIKNDPNATFFPQPELVFVDPFFAQNPDAFQAAWRFEVYAERPQSRKQVYVSARDGKILREIELLCDQTSNTPGTAVTRYSGTRTIVTDSIATDAYRLAETTRGGGIFTFNLNRHTEVDQAVDFLDEDNYWNNVNSEHDEVAADVHWGAEMTFDYYLQNHAYAGVDGNNMPLIAYAHYDNKWNNARWTGDWAQFGDGDGSLFSALTSLDVVGHEFTHGVTRSNANLKYLNESGALNESFSDIFGASIEFWADPGHADWLVGEDFDLEENGLRNMKDPNEDENPDTYNGDFWSTGAGDNGGVHNNSGVQNYWYYLLTEGGSGVNDNGDAYSVNGLGLDTAAAIAFRSLRYYLSQLSEYADAREGALRAAEDLYGICSAPYIETAKAWYAVGVGVELLEHDVRMLNILAPAPLSCGLGEAEYISVQFRYNGCNADLQAGDSIPLAYEINGGPVVWDTLTLTAPLTAGDTFQFTFSVPTAAFATPGVYKIRCRSGLDGDSDPGNNEAFLKIESILDQNVDMGLKAVVQPASACFLGNESPVLEIGFYGCDSIATGEPLTLFYSVDGGVPASEIIPLPYTLHRGESFKYAFNSTSDFSAKRTYSIQAWVQYGPDSLAANDSLNNFRVTNPLAMFVENVLTFEAGGASLDSAYAAAGAEAEAFVSPKAARTGLYGFEMTGGNFFQAYSEGAARIPNINSIWQAANAAFRSKVCICADLSNLASAKLRFDRKQTYSPLYNAAFGQSNTYGSSLRVMANGEQIAGLFRPISNASDPWFPYSANLQDYLGSTVEICFEAFNGVNPALDSTGIGDKVLLDNIAIIGEVVSSKNPQKPALHWSVSPNPGDGHFTIRYQAPEAQTLSVEALDALGRLLLAPREIQAATGDNRIPLDLNGVPAGMYWVRLSDGQASAVRRVVVE